jgi:hypothetical protein
MLQGLEAVENDDEAAARKQTTDRARASAEPKASRRAVGAMKTSAASKKSSTATRSSKLHQNTPRGCGPVRLRSK